ncbi:hypothetical protein VTJ83DRAFT_3500 [Remersonia thermophila]|uniref:Rap-GAP domain-containing protein n=1 Tax=Remersonia thermophila TaxID=72144 RepID=A0ABR4DF39_9PEZI
MPTSPGDEHHPPQAPKGSGGGGGLAGVFKGLTGGSRLTKSPPVFQQPFLSLASSQSLAQPSDAGPPSPAPYGLSSEQAELFHQLKNGQLGERVAAANSLRLAIAESPLTPVRDIWHATKDLIEPSKPADARRVAWELLTECIKYPASTELERREYFDTLTAPAPSEDFSLQLAALEDLTNQGRNLSGFYYEIFPLLTWWLQVAYKAARAARAARKHAPRGTGKGAKGTVSSSAEDNALARLFTLLKDAIKFNFKFATDTEVGRLMNAVFWICMDTTVEDDLRACIHVIETLVTFGAIPASKLKECIEILSSIHCVVPNLQKDAWRTIADICRSHHGQSTVRILLDLLRSYSASPDKDKDKDKNDVRNVRGALSVLKKLLGKPTNKNYPPVPLALLVDGLANVAKRNVTRIGPEILKLINSLFDGREGNINTILAEESWSPIFSVAAQCAVKAVSLPPPSSDSSASSLSPATTREQKDIEEIATELRCLIQRIEELLSDRGPDILQREQCMEFFGQVQQALPDSAAALFVDHLKNTKACLPSEVGWEDNLNLVLDCFYLGRGRETPTRLRALEVVVEVYDFLCLAEGLVPQDAVGALVQRILVGLQEEQDIAVLQQTVEFLVKVAATADTPLFDGIIDAFKAVVAKDMSRSSLNVPVYTHMPRPPPQQAQTHAGGGPSPSNIVARGYVRIFIQMMNRHAEKAVKAYKALVYIARSNSCEADARITAMKMLFRLRAVVDHRVFLTTLDENETLAANLYRTEASLARKLAEDAAHPSRLSRLDHHGGRPGRGVSFNQGHTVERGMPVRSASTPTPTPHHTQRLWSLPDPDALPEAPPQQASPVLVSHLRHGNPDDNGLVILDLKPWLEVLLSIIRHGGDWEVYSFVLAHLPTQLSNHPLFRDAISHIQEMRRVLCELIRTNGFQDPPHSSGLRRTDAANCLLHALAMIVSYHRHFQKVDEDEIVQTFMHGISDKTAKTCIHALSVCCHELPMSVSKSLLPILQRMSQVITQPFVAMHILEFLACLSRLHSLYSNFREDDYRIVFGICFRYLQYVREKKRAMRGAGAAEPPTPGTGATSHAEALAQQQQQLQQQQQQAGGGSAGDDLPQYVYALAYHVITFWFLAVKLPDRPSHIGWIAKNLFTDVDGSASTEEHAQITLDFMQRVAFSDASDSVQDPLFKEQYFGEIQRKRWIIGNSILTIRQATGSSWAEITRRYPSGTSSYALRVEFTPTPNLPAPDGSDAAAWEGRFQSGLTIFPSHLLMQLLAPMPQLYDPAIRPIPLPDEDFVDRAIRVFDRNSAVDGHKVGVIYIGEGQTREAEILANTSGSPDYHRFLKGLGVLTKLKGATFNTQGLDRSDDLDGKYTYCWRDRVTEIVFHVTTQMPTNLQTDPQCNMKKRHIGNDYVNIVWNDSGLPFRFDMFPSQFNYVYIVITPTPHRSFVEARSTDDDGTTRFCTVRVMSQVGFPEISPAADPKMVSLQALPSFVRLLALNASVFSLVWANSEGGEHVSSWRERLRQINALRARYGPKTAAAGGAHGGPAANPPQGAIAAPATAVAVAVAAGVGAQSVSTGGGATAASAASAAPSGAPPEPINPAQRAVGVRESLTSLRRSSVATFFAGSAAAGSSSGLAPGSGPGAQTSGLASGGIGGAMGGTAGGAGSGAPGGPEAVDHQSLNRSGILSAASAASSGTTENVDIAAMIGRPSSTTAEALVESVDFSKWT